MSTDEGHSALHVLQLTHSSMTWYMRGLASSAAFVARFDALAIGLALVESLPLAGLAFAMATLLHKLGDTSPATVEQVSGAPRARPAAVLAHETSAETTAYTALRNVAAQPETARKPAHEKTYPCKRCSAGPLTFAELGRHSRGCKG